MALTPPTTTVDVALLATKASVDTALSTVTTWIDEDRALILAHTSAIDANTAQMASLEQTFNDLRRRLRSGAVR